MLVINTQMIFEKLNDLNISYVVSGQSCEINGFASIKKIESNKVYYSVGSVPDLISNSIVIVDNAENRNKKNNFYIVVDNPQLTFYKLMNVIYSNNKHTVALSSVISPETKLGSNIHVDEHAIIRANSIGDNASIGANVVIHENVTIGDNVVIADNSVIGAAGVAWIWDDVTGERVIQPQIGGVEVSDNVFIGSNVTIVRGSVNENTVIGNNSLISHGTQIGHGVQIRHNTHIANNCALAGNVVIGYECFIGAGATISSQIKVSPKVTVGAGATISKNIEIEGATYITMPARAIPSQDKLNGVPKKK